jgi:cytidine deaminase
MPKAHGGGSSSASDVAQHCISARVGANSSTEPKPCCRIPMKISALVLSELKKSARDAATRAYAPYSGFAVGAAVLTENGKVHTGANVENASYGLSICAERNAIFQAIAGGARRIDVLAVYTPTEAATPPCGACRQVLAEFGAGALVVCCTDNDDLDRCYEFGELLPSAFGAGNLG